MHDFFLPIAAACYLLATLQLYRELIADAATPRTAIALTLLGAIFHALAQSTHWLGTEPSPSYLNVLSLCALTVVLMLLGSLLTPRRIFDAGLIALPIATLVLLAEWLLPAPGQLMEARSASLSLHVISSIMAFGLLSLAGVYALFVALMDHFLRRHQLHPLMRALPALDVLEALLFGLIKAGFALLTLSLASGFLFVDDVLAQHLAHKTLLSIFAWLLFGTLLWGRRYRGWRGQTAVRLTIGGVLLLALAYFGSKWVLEVVLARSWS